MKESIERKKKKKNVAINKQKYKTKEYKNQYRILKCQEKFIVT